jgi:hypothetical protein
MADALDFTICKQRGKARHRALIVGAAVRSSSERFRGHQL